MTFVRCKRCLMPTTRPSTHFEDGVCSGCRNFDRRKDIDWASREEEFLRIADNLRAGSGRFDVIVASSGGKDSTAQVLKMLELGLKPLVVTATTCHLTHIGRKNIDNLSRYAETVEYSPDPEVRKKLNRISLSMVGDISLPEHMAIFSTPFKAAVDYGISTIIYGESPQFEYGGPPDSEQAKTMTRRWIHEHGGFLGMRALDFAGKEGIRHEDMLAYMLPTQEKLEGITAYFLGQYFPWDSHENARIAMDHGFECVRPYQGNRWVHENQDNAQTGIHDYFGFLKYGFGRYCAQTSIDIRHGLTTRDEGYADVLQYDGLFPYKYMGVSAQQVLDRIEVSQRDFEKICHKFTNHALFSSGQRIPREDHAASG